MVDGEENFRLKYQKINEARNSIYIANYDLDPNLRLIRGDNVLPSLQIHGLIASPCGSESLGSYTQNSVDGASDDFDYTLKSFDTKSKAKSRY
jgi:hypothetical protein